MRKEVPPAGSTSPVSEALEKRVLFYLRICAGTHFPLYGFVRDGEMASRAYLLRGNGYPYKPISRKTFAETKLQTGKCPPT